MPSLLGTSPSLLYFSFNNESNWLYSTLLVILVPSFLTNLHIAPIATFDFLGIHIEFISKFNFIELPIDDGIQLNDNVYHHVHVVLFLILIYLLLMLNDIHYLK